MADRKEQVKPLASASDQLRSDDHLFLPPQPKLRHRHRYIKCCGCFAALLLILAVTGIVLGFTVLHIKTPDIRVDSLSFPNGTSFSPSDGEVVLVATVIVWNPNVASFKYSRTTTKVYYGDEVIGEGGTPPGETKARETVKMNVTVVIKQENIADLLSLMKDLTAGALKVSSYTEFPGRVRILGFIKKNLTVKMNCSMTYNSKTQKIEGEVCDQHVKIED